jgi:hypothetical protein
MRRGESAMRRGESAMRRGESADAPQVPHQRAASAALARAAPERR